jgi:hypothetical protein
MWAAVPSMHEVDNIILKMYSKEDSCDSTDNLLNT